MWHVLFWVLTYGATFVAGFLLGGVVAYVRTSRFYLRMTRQRYE